ncbi:MAG: hypothetical protein AAF515_01030 [Pseudomonadota bacterium]
MFLWGLSSPSSAAVFYVELFGDDSNDCRSASSPCHSIAGALAQGSGPDRIIVGDGRYPGAFEIDRRGVRIVSRGGRGATFIGSGYENLQILILADSGRIGQRGRGFTIFGDITIMADNAVIEDNHITSAESESEASTGSSVITYANRTFVRYNTIDGSVRAMPPDADGFHIQGLSILDNVVQAIMFVSTSFISNHKIAGNRVAGTLNGFNTFPGDRYLREWSDLSKNIIRDNDFGSRVLIYGGDYFFEDNRTDFVHLIAPTGTVVRDNHITANEAVWSLILSGGRKVAVVGNTITNTGADTGVSIGATTDVRFRSNNVWGTSCAFDFNQRPIDATPLVFANNHYGAPGQPDLACTDGGEALEASGALRLNPRAEPNRY